jgi:hypothetical protein
VKDRTKKNKPDPLKPLPGEVPIGTIPFAPAFPLARSSRVIPKRVTSEAILKRARAIKFRGTEK